MKSNIIIVVIDDLIDERSPLVVKLNQEYEQVSIFNNSVEGLKFIKDNLDSKTIVILDLTLSGDDDNGHIVLEKIRANSFLIPVLIWTASDEKQEPFADFINNRAFAFIKQSRPVKDILKIVNEAAISLETDVASSLEDWLMAQPQTKDKPYMVAINGKSFTVEEMLNEIRMQSLIGKEFSYKLNKLTIDLLTRNKEKLDD